MHTTFTRTIRCIEALAVMTVFALPALAAKPGISATLEPSHIAVGEAAQLTVTVTGRSGDEPALPHVDGLEFTPMGQSSRVPVDQRRRNGQQQPHLSCHGDPLGAIYDSCDEDRSRKERRDYPAARLASHGDLLQSPSSGHRTRDVPGVRRQAAANGQQAFLRLVTPKRELHVGELLPVQIKAYFRGGVQATINGLPTLSSDAFTLNSLDDKPAQTQENIEGQPYAILTWNTALSAVKAGDYSLSLELPVLLTVREKASQPRDLFGDTSFADSFFDDFFGNSVQKQVTLTSEPDAVSIRPLPSVNRPADFSGALGQFTVTAEATPDHVTAGDPITLRLTVTGRGNFDRVSSSLLTNSHDWKSYKPVARFAPADSIGSEGTKTFEQAVLPLEAGHLNIPPLSFSYFDPETAKYVTRTTMPLAIDVAPVANPTAAAPAAAKTGNDEPLEFAPNRVEPGQFTWSLQPLFLQPRFFIANFLTWIGIATVFYYFRRHTRYSRDPQLARARRADRAIQDQLAAMDSAMQHAETAAFFAAARRALQQRLGERWSLPPESITLTEINARLNGEADGIRPVFQMADQVAYSRENLPPGDLAGWKRILTEQLKQLERR